MRNLHAIVVFTVLTIAHVRCKPTQDYEYPGDVGEDNADWGGNESNDNYVDEDTSSIDPKTGPPPRLYTKSLKLLARLGDDVRLPCNVTNTGSAAVTWSRNGEQLYIDSVALTDIADKIKWENGNTLIISNFNKNDESDDYKCEVTTEPPQKVVHSVRLSKHVFVYPGKRNEIDRPKTVILRCQANWEPKPIFKWFHKGHPVTNGQVSKDGSSLTIHNATVKDHGLYQCLAETNISGEKPILTPINVIVHHAPKVRIEDSMVHTGLGIQSEITCTVDSFPQATVTWYYDNSQIFGAKDKFAKSESDESESNHTLVIESTEDRNFGKYTCKVANYLGRDEGTVLLTGAPSVPKFVELSLSEDKDLVTIWEVTSYLPITKYTLKYRLLGDKEWKPEYPAVVDDGMVTSFTVKHPIKGLQPGTYQTILIAENKYGASESTIQVIKGVPITTKPVTGVDKTLHVGNESASRDLTVEDVDKTLHVGNESASRDRTVGGESNSGGQSVTVLRSLLLAALTLLVYTTNL